MPLWSLVPLVFHDALTIFHAIRLALEDATTKKDTLLVHVVGVEAEARDLSVLSELAALLLMLPATQRLRLHLFGPGIMAECDGEKQELPRLHAADARAAPATVTLLRCADYGSFAEDARYCRPDLIVGLNAGLCAPEYCWETAVRRMIADRVPAIFTDYMRASCEMPLQLWGDLVQEHGGTILEPEVNPFRQPWSRPDDSNSDSSGRYTCMANGHIYGWRF